MHVVMFFSISLLLLEKIRNALPQFFVQPRITLERHAFEKKLLREPGKIDIHLAQITLLPVLGGLSFAHTLRKRLAKPQGPRNWLSRGFGTPYLLRSEERRVGKECRGRR